jgi:hypothetical protein
MANFMRDTVAEANKWFRLRIKAVGEAGGDFFKKFGYTCTSARYL